MNAFVTLKTVNSCKTGNGYDILCLKLDNGIEIQIHDFAAVKEFKNVLTLIKALGLD